MGFYFDQRIQLTILKSGIGVAQVKPPRHDEDKDKIVKAYESVVNEAR